MVKEKRNNRFNIIYNTRNKNENNYFFFNIILAKIKMWQYPVLSRV